MLVGEQVIQTETQTTESSQLRVIGKHRLNAGKFEQTDIHKSGLVANDLAGCVALKQVAGGLAQKVSTVVACDHEIFYRQTFDSIGDLYVKPVD